MSRRRRAWLPVSAIGAFGLAGFFFWSAFDESSIPTWLAIAGGVGGFTGLADAAIQIRDRLRADNAETETSPPE